MKDKQYLLMILDGVGISESDKGNAFKIANTPNIDRYMAKYATTNLKCSGLDVGLPKRTNGKF
jgi:2,3-bisphosphoglycerate-independent phosphoglycerate mutase